VDHPADDRSVGWSPEGKWVLFVSDRTGTLDLWMLPVRDGRSAGEPRLVKAGVGRIFSLGFDSTGHYYFGTGSPAHDIFDVQLDSRSGRALSAPTRAIERFQGSNDEPSYSRDGSRLVYVSARGLVTTVPPRFSVLCIRALDTGEEQELHTDFQRLAGPLFSADGTAVLVAAWDGDMAIQRVDTATGAFSPVVEAKEGTLLSGHAQSPDGKTLYYAGCDDGACWIRSRDLASRTETEIHRGPREPLSIALSPDGRSLAFVSLPLDAIKTERVVRIVPVEGGAPREIFRFTEHGQHFHRVEFSADGSSLLVPRELVPPAKPSWTLLRVPVAGGEAEDLGVRMAGIGRVTAHPDGSRIAFASKGLEQETDEVWAIENLLPDASGRVAELE
jgi:Tol biopolymer transport system component